MKIMKKTICCFVLYVLSFVLCQGGACADHVHDLWQITIPDVMNTKPSFSIVGSEKINVINPINDFVLQLEGSSNWASSQKLEIEEIGIESGATSEQKGIYVGLANNGTVVKKIDLATHKELGVLHMPESAVGLKIFTLVDYAIIIGSDRMWSVPLDSFEQVSELTCEGLHQGTINAATVYDQYLAIAFSDGVLTVLRFDDSGCDIDGQTAFDEPLNALLLNQDYVRYGLVYGARQGKLDIWNYFMKDGSTAKSEVLQWPTDIQQAWYVDGGIYVQDATKSIWCYMYDEDHLLRTANVYDHSLSIINDSYYYLNFVPAIDYFHDVYPNTAINVKDMGNSLGNVTAIQAEKFDLLCISSDSYNLPSLVRSGAIQPLDDYAVIQNAERELIDLWDICSYNGEQYIVPVAMRMPVWEINSALFEKTGIAIPEEGWTTADFFAIGEELARYNQQEGTNFDLLVDNMETGLPYLLKLYLVNHVDFDTGKLTVDPIAFENLIDEYVVMVQSGLIVENSKPDREYSTNALFQVYCPVNYNDLQDCAIIFPPVENEHTRYLIDITGLVLGSNAVYPEEAAQLIASYMEPENLVRVQSVQLGPVLSDQEAWKTEDRRFALSPTKETEAVWQKMAQKSVWNSFGQDVEYTLKYELYQFLANGTIDTETFTDRLTRMIEMMLRE